MPGPSLIEHFAALEDPRQSWKVLFPLPEVLLVVLCAIKVRRDHHIVSVTVIVAVGVNTDGRREVLGMTTGHSEAEPFWVEFLRRLGAPRPARGQAGRFGRPSRAQDRHHQGAGGDLAALPGAFFHAQPVARFASTRSPMRERHSGASSRPGSARRSPKKTQPRPASNGARSPTKPGPACPSSPP